MFPSLQPEHGDRSSAPNIAVLITDGPSNKDAHLTRSSAKSARDAGIDILVVRVGSDVDPYELEAITGSKDRLTHVWDFDQILTEKTIKLMYSNICGKCLGTSF